MLHRLRDHGNSVLVVEHDPAVIRAADWVVDVGPGAGRGGGEVVFSGRLDDLLHTDDQRSSMAAEAAGLPRAVGPGGSADIVLTRPGLPKPEIPVSC